MSRFATALAHAHDQRAIDALRRDVATYRALGLAALDALAASYARVGVLERQLAETRAELRRYTQEQVS